MPAQRSLLSRARVLLAALLLTITATPVLLAVSATPATAASLGQAVLDEAARHAGKPYRYGATGPDSFDCSGFTGYVYRQLGVHLPRSSDDQARGTARIPNEHKVVGDLIFTYDGSGRVYHVGIYAGHNEMWAAPKAGDHVRKQTIWTSSYFVGRPVSEEVDRHWVGLGGARGFLGNAVTGVTTVPDGSGRYRHYERDGSIYWSGPTGAREVHGGIRATWGALGWENSALGYPVTDELGTPDGGGRFNHFQRGSVYWTPSTGAREVRGAIRGTWAALGWEGSALGYPVTNELATPDSVGRYNHFERGSVYWTPSTGAHEVRGAIRDAWAAEGWEASSLGYPVTDERSLPDGSGRYNDFQGGRITWDRTTGVTTVQRR
jgi:uncharacterized protein with LGFP repeats